MVFRPGSRRAGGHSVGNGKALRRTIRRSAREGGLRLRLRSVASAKPPGIGTVSSTSIAERTGSIGQYGAGWQVAHEIRARQDSRASLSTAGGRDESERVDAGWTGSKGGSFGALGKGVGGWRYAATSLLPPPTSKGPRGEHLGPRILKDVSFEFVAGCEGLGFELTLAETSPPLEGDGLGDAPSSAHA